MRVSLEISDCMAEKFWTKVNIQEPDDCWEWIAARNEARGCYGVLGINGKTKRAHRVAFELIFGPIPEGKQICHDCDNPPCCNPNHLFLCTQLENIQDAITKGRLIDPPRLDQEGENNNNSKLTKAEVLRIRRLYSTGLLSQYGLAKKFNTHQSHISLIVRRKIWRHVE